MFICALHGFLGQPQDFNALNIPEIKALDIFRTHICSLEAWSRRLNNLLPPASLIMGYSMGGRLTLNCLVRSPERFRAAIILAAHPGIAQKEVRLKRYEADKIWSKHFLEEPWEVLMKSWHAQPTLLSSELVIRKERDFDRQELARALRYFSLGSQENLIPEINQLEMPILWLNPQEEAHNLAGLRLKNPLSRLFYMPLGGHRFMMSEAKMTSQLITNFINSLE
jgi:2-succinyl-6-hydroxy-2,4-cyclohexadiene-1-carboxylate synthase